MPAGAAVPVVRRSQRTGAPRAGRHAALSAPTEPATRHGTVRLRLLGRFEVTVGAHVAHAGAWPLRRAAQAVQLLALAPGHRLHAERLADLLWPEAAPPTARRGLHQALYVARRVLAPPPAPGAPDASASPAVRLLVEREWVTLAAPGGVVVDAAEFEAAAAAARGGRDAAAYRAALALYGGELLPDEPYADWAAGPRERLRRLGTSLLADLAEIEEAAGNTSAAAETLRLLIADEPAHEAAHVALMRLLARTGQRAEALRQYAALQAALRELDAEPQAASRRAYQEIAASSYGAPRPDALAAPRGYGTPPGAAPAVPARGTPPRHNLPRQLTSFVGRADECLELARLLGGPGGQESGRPSPPRQPPQPALVTVTGPAGAGKTRLALEVAAQVQEAFPDGVWLAELAPVADPAHLPRAVAAALGIPEEPGAAVVDTLCAALSARRLLLVLDNAEHVAGAAADLAQALLRGCPDVRVLVTSREPLGCEGEAVWPLPPLLPADAGRLFLDRAAAADPRFLATPERAQAIQEVCRRLDGLPLALELAAPWVRTLSVEEIAARLPGGDPSVGESVDTAHAPYRSPDLLGVLDTSARAASPRQQSLRAALDWSHRLLPDAERVLFRRLAVFAGGWTLDAVQPVCALPDTDAGSAITSTEHGGASAPILAALRRLVDASLVVADTAAGGAPRYRLLEIVRAYAHERLEAAREVCDLRAAHADYYLSVAEAADRASHYLERTPEEERVYIAPLGAERENFRLALRWLAAEARDPEADGASATAAFQKAVRLVTALWSVWWLPGQRTELREAYQAVLALPGAASPTEVRADLLWSVGFLAAYQSDYAAARAVLEESLAIGRRRRHPTTTAGALSQLGAVARFEGDYGAARRLLAESHRIRRRAPGSHGSAADLIAPGSIAIADFEQGDYARARERHETVLAAQRARDAVRWAARTITYMARCATMQGRYAEADRLLRESEAALGGFADRWATAHARFARGALERLRGRYQDAEAALEEALALLRGMGNRREVALTLVERALTAGAAGDTARGLHLAEEGLRMARQVGARFAVAEALVGAGILARAAGDPAASHTLLEEALATAREIGARHQIASALANLGVLAHERGDLELAAAQYRESLALRRRMDARGGIAAALECLAVLDAAQDRPAAARRARDEAARLRRETGGVPPPAWQAQLDRWGTPPRG